MTASHDQHAIKTDSARVTKTQGKVQMEMNVVTIESPIPQGAQILYDYASQFNNASCVGLNQLNGSSRIKWLMSTDFTISASDRFRSHDPWDLNIDMLASILVTISNHGKLNPRPQCMGKSDIRDRSHQALPTIAEQAQYEPVNALAGRTRI